MTPEKNGRNLAVIDWEKVDQLLVSGQKGTEVAAFLGIHPTTFYRRVEEDKGVSFTEYLQQKRSHGDGLLKTQQFAKAMGYTEKGDNTLLIWLGKTRLEQKEHVDKLPDNDLTLTKALERIHSTNFEEMDRKINELQKVIDDFKIKEKSNGSIQETNTIDPEINEEI